MSDVKPNILIINDGNRRWAKGRYLSLRDGYREMTKKIVYVCDELKSRGFEKVYVTLCSLNNLSRPKEEVDIFYDEYLALGDLSNNRIKIELHGNLDLIPEQFKDRYRRLVENTKDIDGFTLHLLANWSLGDEVVRIVNHLIDSHTTITEEALSNNSDIKDPIDLIIRTGNHKRLSSVIPLNSPFAEIYFLDILFPDINNSHIEGALHFYQEQVRNFGK